MSVSSIYPKTTFTGTPRDFQYPYQQTQVPGMSVNIPMLQPLQPANELIGLHGLDSAKLYPMRPNSTVPTFDLDSDHAFILSSDSNGVSSVKILKFSVVTEEEYRKAVEQDKPVQLAKSDYDALMERMKRLEEEVENAKQSIRSGSSTNADRTSTKPTTGKPANSIDAPSV